MSIDRTSDENIPCDTDAYYEQRASQEEIYLEETEEEVHVILDSYDPSSSPEEIKASLCGKNNDPRQSGTADEQLDHAADELITGDSDDPPLSEDAVVEMVRLTHMPERSDL